MTRYADAYSYGHLGMFTATLRFPKWGAWTLTINDGGPYARDFESNKDLGGRGRRRTD
jgi:hypothetical protein